MGPDHTLRVAILALLWAPAAWAMPELTAPATAAEREARVREACAGEVAPDEIEALLRPGVPELAQIDAARVASCKRDARLAAALFEGNLRSQLGVISPSPDVGYRLHRALLDLPSREAEDGVRAADLSWLPDAVWRRLEDDWLQPLGGATARRGSPISAEDRPAFDGLLDDWRAALLDEWGLGQLQQDGESRAEWLFVELRAWLLALVIREGAAGDARAAAEAALQMALRQDAIHAALEARAAALPELEALRARLPPPETQRWGGRFRAPNPEFAPVGPSERGWVLREPGRPSLGLHALSLVALVALVALWVLANRLWPRRRRALLALGALALGPAAVVALECALALGGVAPPALLRPSFNLGGAVGPGFVTRVEVIDGVEHAVLDGGAARAGLFPVHKPPGGWRVVTLGESSVYGADYLLEDSFSATLERRLQAQEPGRTVEVINAGVGGSVSDEILQFTQEVLRYEPDLLVLYLGHNDLVPLADLVERRAYNVGTIAVRVLLDRLRLAMLLERALPESALLLAGRPEGQGGYLDEAPASPWERRLTGRLVTASLVSNLAAMARLARGRGVDVVIAVQGQPRSACDPALGGSTRRCFRDQLRAVALAAGRASGAGVVDAAGAVEDHREAAGEVGPWRYYWDTVHPTRLGHAIVGEALAPEVERLLRARGD